MKKSLSLRSKSIGLLLALITPAASAQTTGTWSTLNNGTQYWYVSGNWTGGIQGDPTDALGTAHDKAIINANITNNTTIRLASNATTFQDVILKTISIGDSDASHSFIIGQLGDSSKLIFDSGDSGPAVINKMWGTDGTRGTDSDRIDADVQLNTDLLINSSMGLDVRGSWNGNGNDVTLNLPGAGNANSTKLFLNFNKTTASQNFTNIGTFSVLGYGEARISGANNSFGAQNIIIGNGVVASGSNNQRPRAILRFERTDTTQNADITLRQGYLISTTNAAATPQTFAGDITFQGDSNWLQIGNAGNDRYTRFTGTWNSGVDDVIFRHDTGQMRLESDGSNFLGELRIVRESNADSYGTITLLGNGNLNGTGSRVTFERGGSLWIDDVTGGVNGSRIADDGIINFNQIGRSHRTQVRYVANNAGSTETFGTLNFQSGVGGFGVQASTGSTNLTVNGLTIADGAAAQFLVYGNNKTFTNNTAATNNVTIKFNGTLASGNLAGQLSNGIVVGAFGGTEFYNFATSETEHPWLARQLMTVDSSGYLRTMGAADYKNVTVSSPTYSFTEDIALTNGVAGVGAVQVLASDNVRLTGGFGYDLLQASATQRASQTRWDSVYLVEGDTSINSITFAQHVDASNMNGDTTVMDADGNRILLQIDPRSTLTITSGMINFAGTGLFNRADGNLNIQNFIRGGTLVTGPGGDFYLNNNSLWNRTATANTLSSGNSEAYIDSVLAGDSDVIKTGAGTIVLQESNTFTGRVLVHQGALLLRDHLAIQNSQEVIVGGLGEFGLAGGVNISSGQTITVGPLTGTARVLFSNSDHNSYNGDVVIKNVDSAGLVQHNARITANSNSILTLYGDIYGDPTGISQDSLVNASQLVTTAGGGTGTLNLKGVFKDTASGAITGLFNDNNQRNDVLRLQITSNNEFNVQVFNQWQSRGRIYLEQGYLRVMPTITGDFYHSSVVFPSILNPTPQPTSLFGHEGFQMGGGSATSNQNLAVVLTAAGQVFNLESWSVGGDSTNQTGNSMLGAENTSGVVSFGTGAGSITLANRTAPGLPTTTGASVIATYNRDLRLYAAEGGVLNLNSRVLDGGTATTSGINVNSSITKIGKGTANLRGSGAGASSVEQLNVMDGNLVLDFSVNNNAVNENSRMNVNNYVTGLHIVNGGSGYSVGQVITINGGGGTDFRARITSIGGGGEITGVVIENRGQNYTNAAITGFTQTQGTGSATAGANAQFAAIYGSPLQMGGGTLTMNGNAAANSNQNIAGLGVLSGGSEIVVNSQTGFTATLNLGLAAANANTMTNVLRYSGGTLNFVESNAGASITLKGSNVPSAGGIVGPWATYGTTAGKATHFAGMEAGDGVGAFTGYTDNSYATGIHTNVTTGQTFAAATTTATMRFADNAAHTIALGGNLLTLESGAMLIADGHNAVVNISGGDITTGYINKIISSAGWVNAPTNDLIIHHYGSQALNLSARIVDNSTRPVVLVTAGSGIIDLSGNDAGNTYTGGTIINKSTVIIDQENQLGQTPTATDVDNVTFHGGTLKVTADVSLAEPRGITVGGGGATFDVNANNTLTLRGLIASENNVISTYGTNSEWWGDITKIGQGTLRLENIVNNANTFAGLLDIREGTVFGFTSHGTGGTSGIFGTNRNYTDGTIIRSSGTLHLDSLTNERYIYEWLTLDGGTLKLDILPAGGTSNNWQLNWAGNIKVLSESNIEVASGDTLSLTRGGGAIEGSGTINKIGKGTVRMWGNSPDFTGQVVIKEGQVQISNLGDVFGTADGTPGIKGQEIILGNGVDIMTTANNGEVNLSFSNPAGQTTSAYNEWTSPGDDRADDEVGSSHKAQFADAYTYDMYINNDIRVVNEVAGSQQQNKRMRIYNSNYNYTTFTINGNLILEDDLIIYANLEDMMITNIGSRIHTVLNGDLMGTRNLTLSLESNNRIQSGDSNDDNPFYAIYKFTGDNRGYDGVLSIGNSTRGASDFRTYFRPMTANSMPKHWNLTANGYIDLRDAFPDLTSVSFTFGGNNQDYFTSNRVIINGSQELTDNGLTFIFDQDGKAFPGVGSGHTYGAVIRDFNQNAAPSYDIWDRVSNPAAIEAFSTRTNIVKDGDYILALNQANTHTGFTRVDGGILRLDHVSALGAANAADRWTHSYVGLLYSPEDDTITLNPSARGAIDLNGRNLLTNAGSNTVGQNDTGDRERIHLAGGGLQAANGRYLGTMINTSGTVAYVPNVELHGDTWVGGTTRWEFRSLTGNAATDSTAADQGIAVRGNGHTITKVGNNDLVIANTRVQDVSFRVFEGELRIETGTRLDGINNIEVRYNGPTVDPNNRSYELVPSMSENYRPIAGARLEFYWQPLGQAGNVHLNGTAYNPALDVNNSQGYFSGANGSLAGSGMTTADYLAVVGRQSYSAQTGLNEGGNYFEYANGGGTQGNQNFNFSGTLTLSGDAHHNRIRPTGGSSTGAGNRGNEITFSGNITGTGGFSMVGDRNVYITGNTDYQGATIVTRDVRSQGLPQDNTNWGEFVSLNIQGANGSLGGTSQLVVERQGVVFFDDRAGISALAQGRINDSAALVLRKGTVGFKANANAANATYEKIGELNVNYGQSFIDLDSRVIDVPTDLSVTGAAAGDNTVGSGGQITVEFDSYTRETGAVMHVRSLDPTKPGQIIIGDIDSQYLSGAGPEAGARSQIVIGAFGGVMDSRWLATGSVAALTNDKIQNRMVNGLGGGLMTWDSSGNLRLLTESEYYQMPISNLPPTFENPEPNKYRISANGVQLEFDLYVVDNAESKAAAQGTNLKLTNHYNTIDLNESTCCGNELNVNAIEFAQQRFNTSDSTNNTSTYLRIMDDTKVTVDSGVVTFNAIGQGVNTGLSGAAINTHLNLTSIIQGGYLNFGDKEAILNNTSSWLRTSDDTRQSYDGIIRSTMMGSGGLTKSGNSGIIIDYDSLMTKTNKATGDVNILQGSLSVRNSNGLGEMTDIRVKGQGNFYIGYGFYNRDVKRNITVEETGQGAQIALRVRDGSGYWYGDVIDNNTDSFGWRLGDIRLGVDGERALVIEGNLYGGDRAITEETLYVDPRMFDFNGSDRGTVDIFGQIRDNANGAVKGIVLDWETGYYEGTSYNQNGNTSGNVMVVNENQVQRLRISAADNNSNRIYNELVVNFHEQYNAAGRLYMERGIMRYEGSGNFWTEDAFHAIHNLVQSDNSQNGFTGFALGGGSTNNNSAIAASVFLTQDGQNFNIRNFSINVQAISAANVSVNGYSGLQQANYIIGGENTSGVVRYGTGYMTETNANGSSITFGNTTAVRDLTLYANSGGTVEIHSRFQDDGANVTSHITKIGAGTVALMGSRRGDSNLDNVTVRGGVLELRNYDRWNNRRLGSAATLTMGGGTLHMIGGTTLARTEDLAGAVTFKAGGSTLAVTSNFTGTTALTLGNTAAFTRDAGASANFIEVSTTGTANIVLKGSGAPAATTVIGWAGYGNSTVDSSSATYISDFASLDANGNVQSFADTRAAGDKVAALGSVTAGANLQETGVFTGALTQDVNSVLFSTNGASTLDLGGSATRKVNSGGIMIASGVTGLKTISNGTLSATGSDLIFHNYGTDGLNITAVLGGTNVVFAGRAGSVTTLGAANTFTGSAYLNGGIVSIDNINKLGASATSHIFLNGGTLRTTASIETAKDFIVGGNGGSIEVVGTGNTYRMTGDLQSEQHYLLESGYSDNPFFGDFTKKGDGTLVLTRQSRALGNATLAAGMTNDTSAGNDDGASTFDGAIIVEAGILRLETREDSGAAITNDQRMTTLGSNRSFLDGTTVKNGATIQFAPLRAAGNDGATGAGAVYTYEWFTMEAGSTMHVMNAGTTGGVGREMRLDGVINLVSGDITVQADALLRFNLNGGQIQGAGSIVKTGNSTLEIRQGSPLWTGSLKIQAGNVLSYGQGANLGTGTGTHEIGVIGSTQANLLTLQFRSPDSNMQRTYVVDQDIQINSGAQVKRIGLYYVGHKDVLKLNGDLILNGSVDLYAEENNDNMSFGGIHNQDQSNIAYINGDVSGVGTLRVHGNRHNTGTFGDGAPGVLSTTWVLNGDNTNWSGQLLIGYQSTDVTSTRDGKILQTVRLGSDTALNDNHSLLFYNYGRLQLAGHDWSTEGNVDSNNRGSLAAQRESWIENASDQEATITFTTTKTGAQNNAANYQSIRSGLRDGKAATEFGGGKASLNVVKEGAGNTVFGLDFDAISGTATLADRGSFSDYTGTTEVRAGGLYAGADYVFSYRSRHIVSDGALLSTGFDGDSTVNTIGSLQGTANSRVDILTDSILYVGGDNTTGADFAGKMSGGNAAIQAAFVKYGTGDQRLSGNNSGIGTGAPGFFGTVRIEQGALIAAHNNAMGVNDNIVFIGGADGSTTAAADARTELLLAGTASAVQNQINLTGTVYWNGGGNAINGVTFLGSRETSGNYGFAATSSIINITDFFAVANGDSVVDFAGAIIDDTSQSARITKVGEGKIQLRGANTYGLTTGVTSGAAIDGGTVIRHGTVEIFHAEAASGTVIELGDKVTRLSAVDLATTDSVLDDCSVFTLDNNGTWKDVKAQIDGVTLTAADIGKRILVKNEGDDPERNGIYEIVSYDAATGRMTMVRVDDFNEDSEMLYGSSVDVLGGLTQANEAYFMASKDIGSLDPNFGTAVTALHWERDVRNADLAFVLGASDITYTYDIDVNDTNGTGKTSIGGSFTSGTSTYTGTITLQPQPTTPDVDNNKVVTLVSASNTENPGLGTGVIFETAFVQSAGTVLGIAVEGPGTVTINSANQYSGLTTVRNGGNLQVGTGGSVIDDTAWSAAAGTTGGTGGTVIEAGGTISGTGTVGGTGAIGSGAATGMTQHVNSGTIRPGDAGGANVGSLTFTGALTMTTNSRAVFQIGDINAGGGPTVNAYGSYVGDENEFFVGNASYDLWLQDVATNYGSTKTAAHDQLFITGVLTFDPGSIIQMTNLNHVFALGDVFNLIDWTGAFTSTELAGGVTPAFVLPDLDNDNWAWDTSLFMSHGIVTVQMAPEPSKAVLLLVGAAFLLGVRRRRFWI